MVGGLGAAAGAMAALALFFVFSQAHPPATLPVAASPAAATAMVIEEPAWPAETEAAWESSLHTEALLAVEDSSQLTDSEISFLLY